MTDGEDYAGRRLLVTGGTSGIGAVATLALERGAVVAVLDLDLTTAPAGALGYVADVSEDRSTAGAGATSSLLARPSQQQAFAGNQFGLIFPVLFHYGVRSGYPTWE